MSDSDDDWLFQPKRGVGRLLFGSSPAEVEALSDVYGVAEQAASDRISDTILEDTLLEGDLTDEERAEILALYGDLGPSGSSITETRCSGGLVLRYEADELIEILVQPKVAPIRLGVGCTVAATPALEVAQSAQVMGGQAGYFENTTAWFPQIGLIMEGFLMTRNGVPVPIDGGREFGSRSLLIVASMSVPQTARAVSVAAGQQTDDGQS
jgi:hypothetical protein